MATIIQYHVPRKEWREITMKAAIEFLSVHYAHEQIEQSLLAGKVLKCNKYAYKLK